MTLDAKRPTLIFLLCIAIGVSLLSVGIYQMFFLVMLPKNLCHLAWQSWPQFKEVAPRDERLGYALYRYTPGAYYTLPGDLWEWQDVLTGQTRGPTGVPVLFIPGNAGSHKQARSLGYVARSLHLGSPLNEVFDSGPFSPITPNHLDIFTIHFNEELSGASGGILEDQLRFVNSSIHHILDLYRAGHAVTPTMSRKPPKSIVIIGHSMGGVVAHALYSSPDFDKSTVTTIITVAAPLNFPVVGFDNVAVDFHRRSTAYWKALPYDTDIVAVSVSGGRRDATVRDYLTELPISGNLSFSVSSVSVPNAWVSADHQCICWCRQLIHAISRSLLGCVNSTTGQIDLDRRYRTKTLRRYLHPGNLEFGDPNEELDDVAISHDIPSIVQPIASINGVASVVRMSGDNEGALAVFHLSTLAKTRSSFAAIGDSSMRIFACFRKHFQDFKKNMRCSQWSQVSWSVPVPSVASFYPAIQSDYPSADVSSSKSARAVGSRLDGVALIAVVFSDVGEGFFAAEVRTFDQNDDDKMYPRLVTMLPISSDSLAYQFSVSTRTCSDVKATAFSPLVRYIDGRGRPEHWVAVDDTGITDVVKASFVLTPSNTGNVGRLEVWADPRCDLDVQLGLWPAGAAERALRILGPRVIGATAAALCSAFLSSMYSNYSVLTELVSGYTIFIVLGGFSIASVFGVGEDVHSLASEIGIVVSGFRMVIWMTALACLGHVVSAIVLLVFRLLLFILSHPARYLITMNKRKHALTVTALWCICGEVLACLMWWWGRGGFSAILMWMMPLVLLFTASSYRHESLHFVSRERTALIGSFVSLLISPTVVVIVQGIRETGKIHIRPDPHPAAFFFAHWVLFTVLSSEAESMNSPFSRKAIVVFQVFITVAIASWGLSQVNTLTRILMGVISADIVERCIYMLRIARNQKKNT